MDLVNFLLIIAVISLMYRVWRIEITRGKNINVDVYTAVFSHKKFGEITGIKSATEGKKWDDWSNKEKGKWEEIKDKDKQFIKSEVNLTYLASENAYFVRNKIDNPYIAVRNEGDISLIYSEVVVGDKTRHSPYLEFLLYERLIKGEWKLVPCIRYKKNYMDYEKKDEIFDILCEFPAFKRFRRDKHLKKLGFDVSSYGGDDVYTDAFGIDHLVPKESTYHKNGASFIINS